MPVVLKRRRHALQLAIPLHVHVLVGIHDDVADGRVAQQRFERSQSEHFVDEFAKQHIAFAQAQRRIFLGEQLADERADLALGAGAVGIGKRFEVEPVQQLSMDDRFELDVVRTRRRPAAALRPRALRPAARRRRGWRSAMATRGCSWLVTRWTRSFRVRECCAWARPTERARRPGRSRGA